MTLVTDPRLVKVLIWDAQHLGDLEYDEESSTRLHHITLSDLLTPTDCSGQIIRTCEYYGIDMHDASYTGNLWNKGTLITTNLADVASGKGMLPGDLVFYHWRGWTLNAGDPFNHVNMFAGGDLVYNHGGGSDGHEKGPIKESLKQNVGNAQAVRVIRLLPQVVVNPPVPPKPPVPPTTVVQEEEMRIRFPDDMSHPGLSNDAQYLVTGGQLLWLTGPDTLNNKYPVEDKKPHTSCHLYILPIVPGTPDPRKGQASVSGEKTASYEEA